MFKQMISDVNCKNKIVSLYQLFTFDSTFLLLNAAQKTAVTACGTNPESIVTLPIRFY